MSSNHSFTEYFWSVRHCFKHYLIFNTSLQGWYYYLYYRESNWGTERWINLHQIPNLKKEKWGKNLGRLRASFPLLSFAPLAFVHFLFFIFIKMYKLLRNSFLKLFKKQCLDVGTQLRTVGQFLNISSSGAKMERKWSLEPWLCYLARWPWKCLSVVFFTIVHYMLIYALYYRAHSMKLLVFLRYSLMNITIYNLNDMENK